MRTLSPLTRSLFDNFSNLFEESLSAPRSDAHQIFSTPEGWVVRVDLPGFDKSDIDLQFEDKALHLTATRPEDSTSPRPAIAHRFALGEEVDTQSINAKLENGVLEINLPKKEDIPVSQQKITIQ